MSESLLEPGPVAKRLRVSPSTVRELCAAGVFPGAFNVAPPGRRKRWRIPASDVDRFVASGGVDGKSSPEAQHKAP